MTIKLSSDPYTDGLRIGTEHGKADGTNTHLQVEAGYTIRRREIGLNDQREFWKGYRTQYWTVFRATQERTRDPDYDGGEDSYG